MADTLQTVLPVLRERTVYVKNDGSGADNSDFINKSFKGILRLSPNDSATYLEQENYISYDEGISDYISFEDDITTQLNEQFIKVSTSDGYLLDLRLSKHGVEYDNLYILGAVKVTSPLQLYVKDKRSFKLGDGYIVSDRNKQTLSSKRNTADCVPINDETLDDTYVLLNTNNAGMEFVNAKNLIDLFIKEALMELGSVPTGSIHFVPVNIKQYNELLKKSRAANGGHNITVSGNDPLIRDYLLCDGSYYRSTDFPELAKILYNETISYWHHVEVKKNDDNFIGEEDENMPAENYMTPKTEMNNGDPFVEIFKGKFTSNGIEITGEGEKTKVFRVPDLRSMFVQSVVPGLTQKNTVGEYERDSIKDSSIAIKHGIDRHYHYVVLDSPTPNKNTTPGDFCEIISASADSSDMEKLLNSEKVAALARYGAIKGTKKTHWFGTVKKPKTTGTNIGMVGNAKIKLKGGNPSSGGCGECCRACSGAYGGSPIYKPSYLKFNCYAGGPSGGYILSTLNKPMNAELTADDWVGASSWGIDMSFSKEELISLGDKIDNNLNYTALADDPVYGGYAKSYVSYNNTDMINMLGYENTPEFYGVLPLIKI